MEKLLELLNENSKLTNLQLAAMMGETEDSIAAKIEAYEKNGTIRGYQAIIDWDKTPNDYIIAQIQLKVIPQKNMGFDEIANSIAEYEEVKSVYLMSGGCDILLTISGTSFKEVALFVAHRLAPMDVVQSTATSFVLHKYKEQGIFFTDNTTDEREVTKL